MTIKRPYENRGVFDCYKTLKFISEIQLESVV